MIKQLAKSGVCEFSKDSELREMDGKRDIHGLVDLDVAVKELDRGDRHGIVCA